MDTIVYDAVQDVKAVAEYNGGGINALKQDTAALLAKGVVKSVQRGRASGAVDYDARAQLSVNLSPVDASKSFIIVTSAITESSIQAAFRLSDVTVGNFDGESLTIYVRGVRVDGSGTNPVQVVADWQVIEFY